MAAAKKKHRPKLQDWARDGFATRRQEDFLRCRSLEDSVNNLTKLRIGRVTVKGCSAENFAKYYEEKYQPCVIAGVPAEEGWTAAKAWTFDGIRERFKDRLFKVGEDDEGYKVKARMKHFLAYLRANRDDSPLYIFDSSYDEDAVSSSILKDYRVPSFFRDDLFSLVGERRRPPYRWFLMGPERSGSTVHLDPLATSAWNTVLQGRKRWVLFPPGTPKAVAKGLEVLRRGEDDEAVNYFADLLPRIKQRYGPELRIMEFIQEPGETVYVPGGWWHGVLNLTDTIAITQVSAAAMSLCDYLPSASPLCSPPELLLAEQLRRGVARHALRAQEDGRQVAGPAGGARAAARPPSRAAQPAGRIHHVQQAGGARGAASWRQQRQEGEEGEEEEGAGRWRQEAQGRGQHRRRVRRLLRQLQPQERRRRAVS